MNQDERYMQLAFDLASKANEIDEVPVGAVVVLNHQVIGRGYNQCITLNDPSAHAELLAVREAGAYLQNYRLLDATVYVTLEPCPMCAGMLVHARIKRLVFGAFDYKTGACGSVMNLAENRGLNHQFEAVGGVLGEKCSAMLSGFFAKKRQMKKALKD